MDFDALRSLCKSRHSTRLLTNDPVDRETILKLLEVATLAPSVQNTQPWRFHVLLDPALIEKFLSTSCYGDFIPGAGAFIVVTCDKTQKPVSGQLIWNPRELEYSCVAAMEHVLLGATALGLGATWVSLHHGPPHSILHLKDDEMVIGGMMIGVPKDKAASTDHNRKDLAEVCIFHE